MKSIGLALVFSGMVIGGCTTTQIVENFQPPALSENLDVVTFGRDGREQSNPGFDELNGIVDVSADTQGNVFAIDRYHHRVIKLPHSAFGNPIDASSIGITRRPDGSQCASSPYSFVDGAFNSPAKVGTDANGRVYVFGTSFWSNDPELIFDIRACAPVLDYRLQAFDPQSDPGTAISVEQPFSAIVLDLTVLNPDNFYANIKGSQAVGYRGYISSSSRALLLATDLDLMQRSEDEILVTSTLREISLYSVGSTGPVKQISWNSTQGAELHFILGATMTDIDSTTAKAYILDYQNSADLDVNLRYTLVEYTVGLDATTGAPTSLTLVSQTPLSTTKLASGSNLEYPQGTTGYEWDDIVSIAVDANAANGPILYVLDNQFGFVGLFKKIDADGMGNLEYRLAGGFGSFGTSDIRQLNQPSSMTLYSYSGEMYLAIADTRNYRIVRYRVTPISTLLM